MRPYCDDMPNTHLSSSYVNAITSRMYGQNEWCEFRDKMKDLALKYNRDLEDFYEYSNSKMKDYPYDE